MKTIINTALVLLLIAMPLSPAFAKPCKIVLGSLPYLHDSEISDIVEFIHGRDGYTVVQDPQDADILIDLAGTVESGKGLFGSRDRHHVYWVAMSAEGETIARVRKSTCSTSKEMGCTVFDESTHKLRKFLKQLSCN